MSEHPSADFYRARGLADPDLITDDRRCLQCGEALRGKRVGEACPTCGRRVLRHRASGLNELPVPVLLRLRGGLTLALLSWLGGMALWLWSYYGVWRKAGPVIAGAFSALVIGAAIQLTRAWGAAESPPNELWRNILVWVRGLLIIAIVLLGVHFFAQSPMTPNPSREVTLGVLSVAAFTWIALQAAGCLLYARVAAEGGDPRLGDRCFNLAWALGLTVAFMSPYLAVTQLIQSRSGVVPVCCLSGYLVVIAFFVAQVMFAAATIRLRSIVNWAIRYRDQYEYKTAAMIDRIEEARRAGDGDGTAFVRD